MEPRSVLDIKKPMRLVSDGKSPYVVTNVLFTNKDVVFCEVKAVDALQDPTYYYMQFDRYTGISFMPHVHSGQPYVLLFTTWWTLENYEPEPTPPLPLAERAREFARSSHLRVGQMYDDNPYIFHVDMAADVAKEYRHLLPEEDFDTTLAGIYLHDVSEDVHFITYNPLLKEFGKPVAEIAYALENEKGKNRKERANDKYYEGIRNTKGASFAKCCDRIANIRHGVAQGGHMVDGYRKEHHHFKKELFTEELRPMFDEMEKLLGL